MPPADVILEFMENVSAAFENTLARRTLYDYTQFQTRILTSPRGGGKSYLADEFLGDKYLDKSEYFVVIRESQVEVDMMMSGGFWDSHLLVTPKYAEHSFTYKGNKFLIDGKIAGMAFALTTYGNIRATSVKFEPKTSRDKELLEQIEELEKFTASIDGLCTVLFEEFEPLTPKMTAAKRYKAFLHVVETLFRFRENVRVIMCANLEDTFSPFLFEFGFGDLKELSPGIRKSYTFPAAGYKREPLAVWCHMPVNKAWQKLRDNSYVGKLTRGRDDGMFTTGAVSKGNNFEKMKEKKPHRFILYNLTDGVESLTFWKNREETFFITQRTNNVMFPTYTFSIKNVGGGITLIPDSYLKNLLRVFNAGKIEFDNAKSYNAFLEMIPNKKSLKEG